MADRIGTEIKSDSEKTKVKKTIVRGTRYLNMPCTHIIVDAYKLCITIILTA